ncbi:MAG: hypothetical protein NUV65_06475 [Candidatus Roizmanbacteria bacterium]|nr:hypothetical protein [Candidatus Roizmanbacteria bacterium]
MTWTSCLIDGVPTLKCLEVVFQNILLALGGLIFVILLVLFIYGSITILTAGDNAEKLKKGKGIFTSAIIGVVVIAGAYVILLALEQILGINGLTKFTIHEVAVPTIP